MCALIYMHACMNMQVPCRPEKDIKSFWSWSYRWFEDGCCWDLNEGPLQEPHMPFTSEPFLQPHRGDLEVTLVPSSSRPSLLVCCHMNKPLPDVPPATDGAPPPRLPAAMG